MVRELNFSTLKNLAIVLLLLMTLGMVNACSIDIDGQRVELRSNTDGYATTISAEDNSPIDVKVNFEVTNISGSNCPDEIKVNSKIYRETGSSSWQLFRTTSTKTQSLSEDSFTLTWSDEFTTDDAYTRYRIDTNIFDSNYNEIDTVEGYVDLVNNSCSGIKLVTSSISVDESDSVTETFRIENNTNTDFDISSLSILFSNSLIRSGSTDYDDIVNENSDGTVDVTIEAGSTSSDTSTTGTFSVTGYLGSKYCSSSSIGTKSFTVSVNNTGSSSSSGSSSSTSSDCDDLSIVTKDFELNEGTESTQIFYLENDSTKRFEILGVTLTSSGLDLKNYYYEQYVFPSEVADIIIKASAPNVFSNKVYENTIKVKGQFSDGKTCQFDKIQNKTFNVSINDTQTTATFSSCNNFTINAPSSIAFENFGSVPITITNGTNQRADIYVEGSLDASITQISLPANSSISRSINVSLNQSVGSLTLRPSVSGCTFASKVITINNTATGELNTVTMSVATEIDQNGSVTLNIEINNPTSKIFPGVLSITAPNGYSANDKEVTVTPGKNTFSLKVNKTINGASGDIIVNFKTMDGKVSSTVSSENLGAIGLFALGGIGSLIALVLIILVVLVIVGIISSNTEKSVPEEEWMEKKN